MLQPTQATYTQNSCRKNCMKTGSSGAPFVRGTHHVKNAFAPRDDDESLLQ